MVCLPSTHMLVDTVHERAVQVEQKDRRVHGVNPDDTLSGPGAALSHTDSRQLGHFPRRCS
jgi:hypothetical protein